MPEHQQIQQSKKPDTIFQKQAPPASQTHVSNPISVIQRARINPKSLTNADVMQLQRTIGNRAVGRLLTGIGNTSTVQQVTVQRQEIPEEEEPLQGKMIETIQRQEIPEEEEPLQGMFESKPEQATCPSCSTAPVQREEGNRTGMPDNLKSGVEQLSGMDLSDVRVHYNSDKPITAGALAYAQGNNIYLGPGQDMHLPHEVWHVVQQAQGRVKPTSQLKDLSVNEDMGLETEADQMGEEAVHTQRNMDVTQLFLSSHRMKGGTSEVVQCAPNLLTELLTYGPGLLGGGLTVASGFVSDELKDDMKEHSSHTRADSIGITALRFLPAVIGTLTTASLLTARYLRYRRDQKRKKARGQNQEGPQLERGPDPDHQAAAPSPEAAAPTPEAAAPTPEVAAPTPSQEVAPLEPDELTPLIMK